MSNDLLAHARQMEQQQQMKNAAIQQIITQAAGSVYGGLVSLHIHNEGQAPDHETCIRMAHQAKELAPYVAQAFGLVKVNRNEIQGMDGEA